MGLLRGKVEILGAALRIKAVGGGDGLKKRGFSGAVFPGKECDRPGKLQFRKRADGGDEVEIRFLSIRRILFLYRIDKHTIIVRRGDEAGKTL